MRNLLVCAVIMCAGTWASAATVIDVTSQTANVFSSIDGSLGHVEHSDTTSSPGDIDLFTRANYAVPNPNFQLADAQVTRRIDTLPFDTQRLSVFVTATFNTTDRPDAEVTEAVSMSFAKIEFTYGPSKEPAKLQLSGSGGGFPQSGTFSGGFNAKLTGPSDEVIFSESFGVSDSDPFIINETRLLAPGKYVLEMTSNWTADQNAIVTRIGKFSLTGVAAVPLPPAILPSLAIGAAAIVLRLIRRRQAAE